MFADTRRVSFLIASERYAVNASKIFSKKILDFQRFSDTQMVVIDATEYGDVLVLSGYRFHTSWNRAVIEGFARAPFTQGVEIPAETSVDTIDRCGQTTTYPFYVRLESSEISPEPLPAPPAYISYSLDNYTFERIWSYRRSFSSMDSDAPAIGDISNQNWGPPPGNDYPSGYMFLSVADTLHQRSDWKGGLNLTALADAERTAFGWYTFLRNHSSSFARHFNLTKMDIVGTLHGLAKLPYVRDTRRSIGIDGFRLLYVDISSPGVRNGTARRFNDTIGIGDYFYADIHSLESCKALYPGYLSNNSVLCFYVPFRALTNQKFGNLLVAGKTMAQRCVHRL